MNDVWPFLKRLWIYDQILKRTPPRQRRGPLGEPVRVKGYTECLKDWLWIVYIIVVSALWFIVDPLDLLRLP